MIQDGFINLNKSIGCSSQYAVAAVKRLLHVKAGHCGTLDPQAEGVLPICLGKATRLSDLVMGKEKTYIGEICFGVATDSYDAAGTVTATADASHISKEMIEQVLPQFIGHIDQVPPAISALKRDGVPLYKRARRGEVLEIKPRPVMIYNISLLSFTPGKTAYAKIEVDCGQGAYIRSLAFDIGAALGVPAHLSALQRTRTGDFLLKNSYTIEQLKELVHAEKYDFIQPMNDVISFLPEIIITDSQRDAVSHGNPVAIANNLAENQLVRVVDQNNTLLALGKVVLQNNEKLVAMNKVFVEPQDRLACAIGNFDGLHLGHRALFAVLQKKKQQDNYKTAVLTFDPHPLAVINGQPPRLITGSKLKKELLVEYFGIDKVITLKFDRSIMSSAPEDFVKKIIVDKLKLKAAVVGYNFTFADKGEGTAELLQSLCRKYNIDVTIVDEVDSPYGVISSSNIRKHLADGDLTAVNDMLGYWFVMEGEVIYGNQIGRSLGYPTANCRTALDQALPPNGVYASRIEYQGKMYDGVTNFGFKPTIGGETMPLMEAHLFDVDLDLYGQNIRVWFGKFLRPERKFSGLAELTDQINADSLAARQFLSTVPENKHLPIVGL